MLTLSQEQKYETYFQTFKAAVYLNKLTHFQTGPRLPYLLRNGFLSR